MLDDEEVDRLRGERLVALREYYRSYNTRGEQNQTIDDIRLLLGCIDSLFEDVLWLSGAGDQGEIEC